MKIKTKYLIVLIVLGLVDIIIPVPIVALVLIYVMFQRPPWFMEACQGIYSQKK